MANSIIAYQKNKNLYNNHQKNTLLSVDQFNLLKVAEKTVTTYEKLILKD